ncbi:PAS domain-containing protein [Bacillus sp. RG28]|uniref:histidine kinase n=1 Tax=Gottfriedia endophytica TaxID=2820819 RepID=A0A940NQ23_9BACI|nr:ATP-binding protein [Gottfriedia endophytica]MBP0725468.1 PAS domain-containing protein [Gottfriedia endophytica]
MNQAVALIGEKIKKCSQLLKMKLSEFSIQTDSHSLCKTGINYQDKNYCWEKFFSYLGEALSGDYAVAYNSLIKWTDSYGQKAVQIEIPFEQFMNTFHLSRSILLEFLEEVVDSSHISAKTLLEVIKLTDPLIDQVGILFTNQYIKYSLNSKFTLTENEDLKITLKELNALKIALNEATIFAVTDTNDNIIYANDRFCNISKYTKEELIGKNHHDISFSGYHSKEFFQNIWACIQQGLVWKGEIRNKAKDGTYYWVDTTIVPFVDHEGKTYQHISIQNDVTEQKRTEEMLIKSEKLSLVGELAAGIAHEIRNPLTTIKGFVQLLDQDSEDKKHLYTDTILNEIDRINFIVNEFMVLAKPHAVFFSKCNIVEIIKSLKYLLEAEAILKNVIIIDAYESDEMFLFGEKNQLKQVFLNLIKNAIEAMPFGGIITISITKTAQDILISIQDNGVGMSDEQVKRIGEPFYTTKETGNGLGLMMCYKIIRDHNGKMSVQSQLNKGTNFLITFPILMDNKIEF